MYSQLLLLVVEVNGRHLHVHGRDVGGGVVLHAGAAGLHLGGKLGQVLRLLLEAGVVVADLAKEEPLERLAVAAVGLEAVTHEQSA